jgi:pilus assembly protein CpaB
MKRLTPAAVTLLTFVVVGLLVTAYFAKMLMAEQTKPTRLEVRDAAAVVAASPLSNEQSPIDVAVGMRGVSVACPHDSALTNGLLRAGESVDVYLTPKLDDANERRFRGGVTLTLFRGVRVLAISRDASRPESGGSALLELTPEQANVLILARNKGEIALTYNPDGNGDGGIAVKSSDRASLDEILGVPPQKNETVATPPPFVSESFKGSVRSTHEFPASASAFPKSGRL